MENGFLGFVVMLAGAYNLPKTVKFLTELFINLGKIFGPIAPDFRA
jgi:hypothetical protein